MTPFCPPCDETQEKDGELFPLHQPQAREYLEQEMKDNDEKLWAAVSAAMCRTNSATSGRGSISVMPMQGGR